MALLVMLVMVLGTLPVVAQSTASSSAGSPSLTSLTSTSTTTCSTIQLSLSNPSPGDVLVPGDYVVVGQAIDTSVAQPPGVDRVQAFLDSSRDAGGHLIGQVFQGEAEYPQYLNASGFAMLVTIPNVPAQNNTHMLFVYARSQQSGAEEVMSVTFQLNKPLAVGPFTPTPTPPPDVVSPAPCAGPTPTPTFPPFPEPTTGPTPGVAPALTLRVANPAPGDTVSAGMYQFQGLAFDPLAQGSSGVDRVSIFLDPREQGGQFLGDAMLGGDVPEAPFGYQLIAALPNRKGGHMLTVYAHSSVTGAEAEVSVPITIT